MISDDTLSPVQKQNLHVQKKNLRHIPNSEIFTDFKDFVNKKF